MLHNRRYNTVLHKKESRIQTTQQSHQLLHQLSDSLYLIRYHTHPRLGHISNLLHFSQKGKRYSFIDIPFSHQYLDVQLWRYIPRVFSGNEASIKNDVKIFLYILFAVNALAEKGIASSYCFSGVIEGLQYTDQGAQFLFSLH